MRSRLTITAMLVAGLAMSTSGVALGLAGSSGSGTAVDAQYENPSTVTQPIVPAPPTTPTPPTPPTTPTKPIGGQDETTTPTEHASVPKTKTKAEPELKPVEQAAAVETPKSGSSLAFTGYNAIPIAIGGLVLLGLGLVMRRRQRS